MLRVLNNYPPPLLQSKGDKTACPDNSSLQKPSHRQIGFSKKFIDTGLTEGLPRLVSKNGAE